jgi:hypothetical protein
VTTSPSHASESLLQRYANLPLPPDATSLARLCADTLDALRASEAEIDRLRAAVRRNRRIGMALGIIMAVERVTEVEAGRLLRNRGAALRWPLRTMAERIICGPSLTDDQDEHVASLASVTPLIRPVPSRTRRTARS